MYGTLLKAGLNELLNGSKRNSHKYYAIEKILEILYSKIGEQTVHFIPLCSPQHPETSISSKKANRKLNIAPPVRHTRHI